MKTFLLMVVAVLVLNAVCADLPEGFAISSRQETRDYSVSSNGIGKFITLTAQYDTPKSYAQFQVSKNFIGYKSFDECLTDTESGFQLLVEKVRKATNYAGGNVGFDLSVWYSEGQVSPVRAVPISLVRIHGKRDTLLATKIAQSFRSFEVGDLEQAITIIPQMRKIEIILTTDDGTTSSMVWTPNDGVHLSNWPKPRSDQLINELYFGVASWVGDYKKARINLLTTDGRSASYTQYGAKITPPLMEIRDKTIQSLATPGGELDIVSSSSLKDDWRYRGTYLVPKDGRVVIPVHDSDIHFYRGICR